MFYISHFCVNVWAGKKKKRWNKDLNVQVLFILSAVFNMVDMFLHCKLFSSEERPPNSHLDSSFWCESIKMIINTAVFLAHWMAFCWIKAANMRLCSDTFFCSLILQACKAENPNYKANWPILFKICCTLKAHGRECLANRLFQTFPNKRHFLWLWLFPQPLFSLTWDS